MNGILEALGIAKAIASLWQGISETIAQAQAENRDLTAAELNSIRSARTAVNDAWLDELNRRRASNLPSTPAVRLSGGPV